MKGASVHRMYNLFDQNKTLRQSGAVIEPRGRFMWSNGQKWFIKLFWKYTSKSCLKIATNWNVLATYKGFVCCCKIKSMIINYYWICFFYYCTVCSIFSVWLCALSRVQWSVVNGYWLFQSFQSSVAQRKSVSNLPQTYFSTAQWSKG